MSANQKVWVFFNIKSQVQTKAMTHAEAHVFILQTKTHEVRQLVAWTPGWQKWIPLHEVLKAEHNLFELPPPVSQTDKEATQLIESSIRQQTGSFNREKTYTEIELVTKPPENKERDFAPEAVNWEKTPVAPVLKKTSEKAVTKSVEDRREYKRFPHRIEFVLMTKKGKSFRSSSINVSLGGALLREPIPADILADTIDLVVINPFPDKETPSHLLIKGRVVGDSRDQRRLSFFDISPEAQQKLRFILDRYQKNYQLSKKKKAA